MISRKSTNSERSARTCLGLLLVCMFAASVQAQECPQADPRQEADCLRKLVAEIKQDMRTLISDVEKYKAKAEEFVEQSRLTETQFKTLISNKDTIISKQDEIISKHVQDVDLANKQIDLYKTCCLGTVQGRLRLHVGVGATGSDTDMAGLIGVGLGNFNVFGFFQENNSGVMLGYQF